MSDLILVTPLPLLRLALFMWCLAVWVAGVCLLRPTPAEQRAGVMAAWVHAAAGVGLDSLAVRLGAWEYRPMPLSVGGVPLDLHLGWALVWGFLPLWLYSRLRYRALPYLGAWVLATVALDAVVGPLLPFLARRAPGWWRVDLLLLFALQGLPLWVYRGVLDRSPDPAREAWRCRARSLLYVGTLAALFYGYLPAVVLSLTGGWDVPPILGWEERGHFALALAPPLLLGAWATLAFTDAGHGTPLPPDPPRRLVTTGPYAYVRNPMQISGLLLAVLLVLVHPTSYMVVYAVDMALVAIVLFEPHERVQLEATFGESYRHYTRHVRNWLPRCRPYAVEREEASGQARGVRQEA